jgi:HPt (histidine-containing phosphotransfer) domain-containing protein
MAMLLETVQSLDSKDAPALAPDDRPIDLVHLARTTFGDRALEREVLQLFDRQSSILIARMRTAGPAAVAALAHTLKGSARGIGAWRVARAAELLEVAGASGKATADALDGLIAASDEARTVIAELLRAN